MKGSESLTPALTAALEAARRAAEDVEREYIGTDHLLLAMLNVGTSTAVKVLQHLGVDIAELKAAAEGMEPPAPAPWGTTRRRSGVIPEKSAVITSKAQVAYEEAVASGSQFGGVVGTGQMLVALFDAKGPAGALMAHFGINVDEARRVLRDLYVSDDGSFRADDWGE